MTTTVFKHTVIAIIAIFSTAFSFAQVNFTSMDYSIPKNQAQLITLGNDFFHSLVSGDFEKVSSLMTDDFQVFGNGPQPLDKQTFIDVWKGYHKDGTSHGISEGQIFAVNIKEGPLAGPVILMWGAASWTPNGADKPIVSWVHNVMQVKDGKIGLIYHHQDQLSILMQMGFTVVPPSNQSGGK